MEFSSLSLANDPPVPAANTLSLPRRGQNTTSCEVNAFTPAGHPLAASKRHASSSLPRIPACKQSTSPATPFSSPPRTALATPRKLLRARCNSGFPGSSGHDPHHHRNPHPHHPQHQPPSSRSPQPLADKLTSHLFVLPPSRRRYASVPRSHLHQSIERMTSAFDLKKNYAFYGAYHTDWANKAIHILCVWPILFSALLLLQYTPPLLPAAAAAVPWGGSLSLNLAGVVSAVYAAFYLFMEPKAGAVAAALLGGCLVGSQAMFVALGADSAWKVAAVMQVFCWSAQFAGHGIFEGRAPALLDNLLQAFLMAPFFVLLEVLHALVQFEPEVGFWETVNKEIKRQTSAFKAKDKAA